jgi:FAD/FMN-containing dehydrogenase
LKRIALDAAGRRATVQPGCRAGELAAHLAEHGLAFPVGHCAEVPVSGYLLAGGLGWNIGTWGPACASVRRIELVTADGEIVNASSQQNADLFWAARGAGSGFFGIVTSFELEVYEQPRAIRMHSTMFDSSSVQAVGAWIDEIVTRVHPSVEIYATYLRSPSGEVVLAVSAFVFATDDATARERITPFSTRPAALVPLAEPVDVLLEALQPFANAVPPAPSFVGVVSFGGKRPPNFVDAALSVGAAGTVGASSFWDDATQDAERRGWIRAAMDAVAPHANGSYVGESDLATSANRVRECFSPEAWTRLNALKAQHDPSDLFFSYLTEA